MRVDAWDEKYQMLVTATIQDGGNVQDAAQNSTLYLIAS
jgi:hypothetical protein